jgi:hypothetical protein
MQNGNSAPSPGADVAGVSPVPGADVAAVRPVPVALVAGVSPVPVQMWQGLEARKPFFAFLSPLTSRSRASFVLTRAPSLYRCVAVTLFRLLIESVILVGVSPRLSNVYCPRSRWHVASDTWILPLEAFAFVSAEVGLDRHKREWP